MSEAGILATAGLALEYQRLPAMRTGPTLVLLHEGLGCVSMWKRFPALLHAASGLATLIYSRAGYGRSTPVVLPRPLDFHTREALEVLPAVLDAAGVDDCVLVGHSDGASIAIIHAGSARDRRVRALVLMAPHVLTEWKTVMTIAEARCQFAGAELREKLTRRHGANLECAFWGWCDAWLDPRFRSWNIESHLAAIAIPVMTLRGEADPYSSAIHVERIAAMVGGPLECHSLPGCGHAPHLEQPEKVAADVAGFIARTTGCVTPPPLS